MYIVMKYGTKLDFCDRLAGEYMWVDICIDNNTGHDLLHRREAVETVQHLMRTFQITLDELLAMPEKVYAVVPGAVGEEDGGVKGYPI